MIKNHIKSIYILLILVSFINFSCTEEFLEINANQITVDAISKDQAIELVNGILIIFF